MEDQQTPSSSDTLDNFFSIAFDASTRANLKQAAVWAKVISLSAFIGYAIALVVAIFGQQEFVTDTAGFQVGNLLRAGSLAGVLITIIIGGLINYFLYRFATATAKGMDAMDSTRTNQGFDSLRIYFKIYGIILIIVFAIALLFILIVIIGAGLAGR